jgi:hypothetical protein
MIIGHDLDALPTGSMTAMLETDLLPDKSPDKRPDKSQYPYQDRFTERVGYDATVSQVQTLLGHVVCL